MTPRISDSGSAPAESAPAVAPTSGSAGPAEAAGRAARRRPRRPTGFAVPRPLPWESFLSRAWAGTLIAWWTALTTLTLIRPSWTTLGAVGSLLLAGTLLARVPPRAAPRPPAWFWAGLVGALIGASLGGGFWIFVRACLVALVILWGSSLILWTVPTTRLAGALHRLLGPLRLVGAPVDEWARIMRHALRALPVLRDQTTAVTDTVKLRLGGRLARLSPGETIRLGVDIVTAALSAASRGAADTGRAMSMRGGLGPIEREPVGAGWRDLVVSAACAAASAAILVWG
ncbi:energy-coupling factor transporter transmembrane protein EcfT [Actinomyces sp. B33]|uniref:energy-coupling factor transporter transmembrane component T n=1 Tax=Actinomyces sp. B33 TaxID=2942131 RepID=UPI0023414E02|nr:energy-coupling factor transporter transmembrane component T [Actinomyces sp. B33]MDC4233944.1 energy-coupling factor transporter transmembrane protein EcfT [Actinomyces sp. B33]